MESGLRMPIHLIIYIMVTLNLTFGVSLISSQDEICFDPVVFTGSGPVVEDKYKGPWDGSPNYTARKKLGTSNARPSLVTMPIVSATDTIQSASQTLRGFLASQTRTSLGMYVFLLSLLSHLLWKLYVRRRDNPRGLPFPPGPKPLPLIGNMFDFARENESAAYLGMAHKYGEYENVFFFSFFFSGGSGWAVV